MHSGENRVVGKELFVQFARPLFDIASRSRAPEQTHSDDQTDQVRFRLMEDAHR